MNQNIGNIYSNYIVAFIDVLGQQKTFKSFENILLNEENKYKIEQGLPILDLKTTSYVKNWREVFNNYFKGVFKEERPVPPGISADKIIEFKEMRKSNIKYKWFSDCMQVSASLHTRKYHCHAVNAVLSMLTACGQQLLISLGTGRVYRAGIDIGIGTEIEENEIYGPVMSQAYQLESKIAQYPRIVIGGNIKEYFNGLLDGKSQLKEQTGEDIEVCKSSAKACLKFIKLDFDGYLMLDYLGKEFTEPMKKSLGADFYKIFNSAFNFVESEYYRFAKERDNKLTHRYYFLYQYFLQNKSNCLL